MHLVESVAKATHYDCRVTLIFMTVSQDDLVNLLTTKTL